LLKHPRKSVRFRVMQSRNRLPATSQSWTKLTSLVWSPTQVKHARQKFRISAEHAFLASL
jgi:hypothetical protein